MLLTAVQGIETSPMNSLLMVNFPPSFLTIAPVMTSPLVSTTWSAQKAGRHAKRQRAAIRFNGVLRSAALVCRQMALLVFLPASAPTGIVASDLRFVANIGFVVFNRLKLGTADIVHGDLSLL